jgi:hypothetical protein
MLLRRLAGHREQVEHIIVLPCVIVSSLLLSSSLFRERSLTVHITDDVASHPLANIQFYEGSLPHEVVMCSKCNFPYVSLRECLPVLEPLSHALNELGCDLVLPILLLVELGSLICFVDLASACS